jgi:hypothetical protein
MCNLPFLSREYLRQTFAKNASASARSYDDSMPSYAGKGSMSMRKYRFRSGNAPDMLVTGPAPGVAPANRPGALGQEPVGLDNLIQDF